MHKYNTKTLFWNPLVCKGYFFVKKTRKSNWTHMFHLLKRMAFPIVRVSSAACVCILRSCNVQNQSLFNIENNNMLLEIKTNSKCLFLSSVNVMCMCILWKLNLLLIILWPHTNQKGIIKMSFHWFMYAKICIFKSASFFFKTNKKMLKLSETL